MLKLIFLFIFLPDVIWNFDKIELEDITVYFPLKIDYLAPFGCATGTSCDDEGAGYIPSAIDVAIKRLNANKKLEVFHNLSVNYVDTSKIAGPMAARTAALNNGTVAVMGLSRNCYIQSTVLNINAKVGVSDVCEMDLNSVKGFDQTTVLMNSQTNSLAKSVVYFLTKYDWKKVAIVSPSTTLSAFDSRVRSDLLDALTVNKIDILVDSRLDPMADVTEKVKDDAQKARIFIICDWSSNANLLRNYLFKLGELNKMQSGEYFVIGFVAYDTNYQWLEATSGDQRLLHLGAMDINDYNLTENDLHEVYKNFIVLSDGPPPAEPNSTWKDIQNQVLTKKAMKMCPPFCNASVSEKTVPRWDRIKLLFDGIQYLADATNDALNVGANIYQSAIFYEYMISRQIKSVTGFTEFVDGYGAIAGSMQVYYHFSSSIRNSYSLFPCARLGQTSTSTQWVMTDYSEGLSIDFVNKSAPKDTPECGFYGEKCGPPANNTFIIVISVGVAVLIGLAFAAAFLYKRYRYERKLHSLFFMIDRNQIILKKHTNLMSQQSLRSMASIHGSFVAASQALRDSHFFIEDYNNVAPATSSSQVSSVFHTGSTARAVGPFGQIPGFGVAPTQASEDDKWHQLKDFGVGLYEGRTVALKRIYRTDVELTRSIRMEIAQLQESVNSNVIEFVGMVIYSPDVFLVYELAPRGSLKDILDNDDMPLDDVFRSQMTKDIIAGLEYLHSSPVGCHGRLKSTNCLIDGRWMVRLSSFGLRELRSEESWQREEDVQEGKDDLWTAPELLRWSTGLGQCGNLLVQKADVYSLAIVLYELFGRLGPWGDEPMEPREIVSLVKRGTSSGKKVFRPDMAVLKDSPKIVQDTVAAAWTEDPLDRPSLYQIKRKLKPLTVGLKRTIMDNMVSIIEKLTDKLERDIAERNEELEREKEKSEMLLKMMLPEVVADSLKLGSNVSAESFENVTVFFSDCPGFVEMSATSKPIDIVQFLNDLYTCFDRIIDQFDVYKVETIADAYMVASGLPVPNGNHHAGEIASLGLALLKAIETFKIRHLPNEKVRLRIGMNSGPCVAGVVGLKVNRTILMPRYCLFGDTVNTASRMESNGIREYPLPPLLPNPLCFIALRINCSESAKQVLDTLGGYEMEERGIVEMKGKGKQMTYFVRGEDSEMRRERIIRERVKFSSLKKAKIQEKTYEFL
ncbi:CRE-GCY-21 protein [Caenorhabditis remanei]|uniref:guanylate cyclase n=1 Tax=Caenorhabditis remanei TaxID=31234 RepID=E3M1U2_CAERE|nr:CRE-GCY-21 protein [Caenorhabditis remanei]